MLKTLFEIFVVFFKSSMLSYGGGPASIPLMKSEVVENYKWFTDQEFLDALAVGNTLPGPIAPKMAAYIGNNVGGVIGAVVGVAATVVPTALAVVILGNLLYTYKDSPRVQGMLKVARPMVVVLLLYTAYTMMSKKTYPNVMAYIVSVIALLLVIVFKVQPAIVVIIGLALGFLLPNFF